MPKTKDNMKNKAQEMFDKKFDLLLLRYAEKVGTDEAPKLREKIKQEISLTQKEVYEKLDEIEERFWQEFTHSAYCDEKRKDYGCVCMIDRFMTFLKQEISLAQKEVYEEVYETIKRMKLWSKGTVEGTRNDIVNKLKFLKEWK